jgi:hypothetical protein
MRFFKVAATHAAIYLLTYSALDFVEDHLTPSGEVALVILGLSVPLSFMANFWAVGDLAGDLRGNVLRAALITALISPFSLMIWLTLYVKIVRYESQALQVFLPNRCGRTGFEVNGSPPVGSGRQVARWSTPLPKEARTWRFVSAG